MTNEQVQQVLDEIQGVRPEMLTDEAKRLFEAIMKIADERDELRQLLKEKDKELEMLKDFKEIAENKVTELSPIRLSENKSINKQTMS